MSDNESSGCGSIFLIWVLLIILKAVGVLNLSWLVVIFAPILIPLAITILVFGLILGFGVFFGLLALFFISIVLLVLVPAAIITESFK